MRKQMTEEQQAAYNEKMNRLRDISSTISNMTEDERFNLAHSMPAIVTAEGRALSVHNSCMVISQDVRATMIGGFQQWQKLGRRVKKGEKGVYILVPLRPREEQPRAEGTAVERLHFRMVAMFDVSQTEEDGGIEAEADVA